MEKIREAGAAIGVEEEIERMAGRGTMMEVRLSAGGHVVVDVILFEAMLDWGVAGQ